MSSEFLFRFFRLLTATIHRRIHIEHFEFSFHICRLTHAKNNLSTILKNGIDCFVYQYCDGIRCVCRICGSSSASAAVSHKILCKVVRTIVLLLVIITAIVVIVFIIGAGGVSLG